MKTNYRARITLRPIRFAAIVAPNDAPFLRAVIELYSSLWGGVFNCIIPVDEKSELSLQRARYLMDNFEPDYLIVKGESKTPLQIEFDKKRVIEFERIFSHAGNWQPTYGVSSLSICGALYDEHFRYAPKHETPTQIVIPKIIEADLELLGSALYGQFPTQSAGENKVDVRRLLLERLDGESIEITQANYFRESTQASIFPIDIGAFYLRLHRSFSPTFDLLFLDGTSPLDIVDFWNLRAFGHAVLPVPVQWRDEFAKAYDSLVLSAPKYPKYANGTLKLLATDSVNQDQRKSLVAQAKISDSEVFDVWSELTNVVEPFAKHVTTPAFVDGREIEIELPMPTFLQFVHPAANERWAFEIVLLYTEVGIEHELVLRPDINNLFVILHSSSSEIIVNSNGLVLLADQYKERFSMRLPDPLRLMERWLQSKSLGTRPSGSGRSAEQVIGTLDGAVNARWLAFKEVLDMFENAANGLIEHSQDDLNIVEKRPKRLRHDIEYKVIEKTLLKLHSSSHERMEEHLQMFCNSGVLRLGLLLKCPSCELKNWFRYNDLGRTNECERCLLSFEFPESLPLSTGWSYRTQGVFTLPGFANGAYAVVLAIRFLCHLWRCHATWATGIELTGLQPEPTEVDLWMWCKQARPFLKESTQLVIGECKTFDGLKKKEFDRIRALATIFPDAVFLIAKCSFQLTDFEKEEIKRMTALDQGSTKPLNILILTGHELFASSGPPDCWSSFPSDKVDVARMMSSNLQNLCAASQTLHL